MLCLEVCRLVKQDVSHVAVALIVVVDSMYIQTDSGNTYSYLRQSNTIVGGLVEESRTPWLFASLYPISSMHEVNMYVISITEQCNLRCTYCCYSGSYSNNRTHSTKSMTTEDIDSIFTFIEEISPNRDIRIAFYGGEPLLNYTIVKYAICEGYKLWKGKVTFSISTNGTLLTNEVIDWLVSNNVEIALSVDGTEQYHDLCRKDINGGGSFMRVRKALSYIKDHYVDYFYNVVTIMTLPSFKDIDKIAEAWHNDPLLRRLTPVKISGLSPNFNVGIEKKRYEDIKGFYSHLLDTYQQHQDWNVLKVFLNQCIVYWKDRPILVPTGPAPMPTCLPINTRLYIDSKMQIGVCEKISDMYRIGCIKDGIDWGKVNAIVRSYYDKRVERCKYCSAVRMCDMCLTAVEYTDEQWDILCHNEREYARLYMYLYCEMAERGLIE